MGGGEKSSENFMHFTKHQDVVILVGFIPF